MHNKKPQPLWHAPILSGLLLLISSSCFAQTIALAINNKTQLDFGTISSENGTCSMNAQGNLTGSNGQSCFGSGTPAKFHVNGSPGYSFFITTIGSSSNGVTIAPAVGGNSSIAISSKGKITVNIVGDLILNNASSGNFGLSYIVSVNYE